MALSARPMGELNAAVQLAVLLRGVGDDRVGFAAAGDPEGVIGLVQLRLQHPRHGGSPLTRQNQTMVRTAEVIGVANDADPTWTTAVDHLSQLGEPSPYARPQPGTVLGEQHLRVEPNLDLFLTLVDPGCALEITGWHDDVAHRGDDSVGRRAGGG
jgi:hypothetical protein